MKPQDAIDYFGNQRRLSEALGIHEANVSRWKKAGIIPIAQALKLVDMTRGELALRLRDYIMWTCETCLKKGKPGNIIRTYTVTSPLSEFEIKLCWPCASRQMAKKRPHVHIRDRVTL